MKKYLLEYNEWYNEPTDMSSLIKDLSKKFTSKIKSQPTHDGYKKILELEIDEDFIKFDICLIVSKDENASLEQDDPYFKGKKQALTYLDRNGFIVTGNTFIDGKNIPLIEIIVVSALDNYNYLHKKMYYKMINVIAHEINHLKQTGWNRDAFSFNPNTDEHKHNRSSSRTNYKYFLLPEEIESIIYGMNTQSINQNKNIDEIFDEYLDTYVDSKFMNASQKNKIIKNWIKHTLKYYPLAKFSNKYNNIIHNI